MEPALLAKLEKIQTQHDELMAQLATPEVASDHQRSAGLAKQVSDLREVATTFTSWRDAEREVAEAREMLSGAADDEEREFYGSALRDAEVALSGLDQQLVELMTPRDPRDDRNVIVEIRAGAGGEEAALFAGELYRMYQRYAERMGWKTDVLEAADSDTGGLRDVVFEVKGKGAFSRLRWESGVHRVQRVPATESSGRIHTSTATVAVLPEADDVEVQIADEELRVDYFRSSGPGGQHVNTTDSAVRITHLPSGIVVSMQSERSQRQNRERAMRVLMAKLKELADKAAHEEMASERKSQVGSGERSEKIRTYNFPQNRITDHRIGLTLHSISQVMDGDIGDMTEALMRNVE